MKLNKSITIFINAGCMVLMIFTLISCNKDEPELPISEKKLKFDLLILEKDTIQKGETSTVEAIAEGVDLTYNWSASFGDILGSGSKVIYGATPCALGDILIKCEVTDASKNSEEKTVKIFVKP